ncbi:hypothetical protein [Lysinibacter sp. HNR]|uniref:hypothetical protein n=1 Tax=Lysinibacter sp. HNR TaxID=3031408 RepID=UPI00243495B7|nr:hypothetical protein [Lysinibacter sp. HNR]WGD38227.1 hypothetical protein FrondiHNR_04735 [Lysinibacter sp. HNR]
MNTAEANNITAYVSNAAGVITLQPGTYELNGSLGGITDTAGGNGKAYGAFFNVTAGTYIGHGGTSTSGAAAATTTGVPNNTANAVITVAVATQVALRVNVTTGNVLTISNTSEFSTASLGRAWVTVTKF